MNTGGGDQIINTGDGESSPDIPFVLSSIESLKTIDEFEVFKAQLSSRLHEHH